MTKSRTCKNNGGLTKEWLWPAERKIHSSEKALHLSEMFAEISDVSIEQKAPEACSKDVSIQPGVLIDVPSDFNISQTRQRQVHVLTSTRPPLSNPSRRFWQGSASWDPALAFRDEPLPFGKVKPNHLPHGPLGRQPLPTPPNSRPTSFEGLDNQDNNLDFQVCYLSCVSKTFTNRGRQGGDCEPCADSQIPESVSGSISCMVIDPALAHLKPPHGTCGVRPNTQANSGREGVITPSPDPFRPPSSTSCVSRPSEAESFETRSSSSASFTLDLTAKARRNVVIERINTWAISWLNSRLAVLAFQVARGGEEPQGPQQGSSSKSTNTGDPGKPPRKKVRGQDDRRDFDDDESDEGEPGQPRQGDSTKEGEGDDQEFACPFFKHNPQKYQKGRCSTKGWPSVHRVK